MENHASRPTTNLEQVMENLNLGVNPQEEANGTDDPNIDSIAAVPLPSMDFGSELDAFIAAYGEEEDEDSRHEEENEDPYAAAYDTEFDSLLEEHAKAMENDLQRQIDDQIQQALQDQLDEQMEDYLRQHESKNQVDYDYDKYYGTCDDSDNDDQNKNNNTCMPPSDPSLSFLSTRLAKAVRLEASVPTVAEINADIQKIVEQYQQGHKEEVQERYEQQQRQQGGGSIGNKRSHGE